MRALKLLLILLAAYAGLVIAFESLVGFMGKRQAEQGIEPGESWLVITTTDAHARQHDTVVAGVESGGHLYVAANHWPRAWYDRAVAHPDVETHRGGVRTAMHAVPVTGEERDRIAADYKIPWVVRLLTGFPPRRFLRLDPR